LRLEAAAELLEQLPQVPRFDMLAACMSSKQRAALGMLWDVAQEAAIAAGETSVADRLAASRKRFKAS
jgi:alkylhydroperoxidase family enzyme